MPVNPILKILLLPLSLIYGIVVYIRNKLFDMGILPATEFNLPVISVGNITAGGTGKTPVIEYLTDLLKKEFEVAVLSRGYKRKTSGFLLADENSSPAEIGDEPCQIKEKYPDIRVAVSRSRVKGVRKLLALHPETEVILLDDAYQHRYITPGISILLIDFNNPVTKDMLLPAGLLREPPSGIKRADIILVTKCPEKLKPIDCRIMVKELELFPFQQLFFTTVHYGSLCPVFEGYPVPNPETLKERKPEIILLSGIANPRPLKKYARGISTKVHNMAYPDHYKFTLQDIMQVEKTLDSLKSEWNIILTTEKDTTRLRQLPDIPEKLKKVMYFVPIRVFFLNDETKKFNNLILSYVRSNKKNSILYKGKN